MSILRLTGLAVTLVALCAAAPINVALSSNGGVATQSSTYLPVPGGDADNAIDGDTNGNWNFGDPASNTLSHTESEPNAWWKVAFNAPYFISSIDLFNRTDCCADRLNNFSVFLYDAANVQVWSSPGKSIIWPQSSTTLAVNSVLASSLKVQLDGTNYLHLAEVQVMGDRSLAAVPEPATYAMMAGGLLLLGMLRRRKQ